jgi:putative peptidoglycan lipid II flippase
MAERAPAAPAQSVGHSTVARDSLTVSAWTSISRVTGLIRMVVAGAVLGPTFLANIYSSTNLLPTLLYQMMAGPLIAAMLAPPLVRHFDRGDLLAARRFGNASFGLMLSGFFAAVVLAFALSPGLVQLLALGVPQDLSGDAQQVAWVLLLLVAPQVLLYGVTGVATAVQQSRGRFALPAAAQIIENAAVITVLIIAGRAYSTSLTVDKVEPGFLLLIGLGTTAATASHALIQWLGARAAGLTLIPTFRWSDPEVRGIARLALPSIGTAAIGTAQYFALVVISGLVPGGVIAMQIGVQFSTLPVALGARPISQALLPRLARLHHAGDRRAFTEYRTAVGMALWIAIPATLGLVVLSEPIAAVVAVGEMATPRGQDLVRAAVAGFGLTVVGLSVVEVARQAAYSSRDARGPFQVAVLRTLLTIPAYAAAAFLLDDAASLLALGVGAALAGTIAAALLDRRVRGAMRGDGALTRWIARDLVLSAVAVSVAWLVQSTIVAQAPDGRVSVTLALFVAAGLGFVVYATLQFLVGSPEFAGLGRTPQLSVSLPRPDAPTRS